MYMIIAAGGVVAEDGCRSLEGVYIAQDAAGAYSGSGGEETSREGAKARRRTENHIGRRVGEKSGREDTSREGAKARRTAENQIARRVGEKGGRGETSRKGAKARRRRGNRMARTLRARRGAERVQYARSVGFLCRKSGHFFIVSHWFVSDNVLAL